ncbi:MAG: ATP-dependent DNA helicase DinG [Gammaproteobacteria bacterium]|nr:ATP-dependent DNA helicase DinG [Gammaproteobacteria bacterium]
MLPNDIKADIQAAYRQYLKFRDHKPRDGQKQMIARIANAISEEEETDGEGPICVVEAGTGIGKTLAYLLAAIPIAQARNLKLVIATATIALQEQLIHKDIPDLQKGTNLEFSYALAKGRRRYLCLAQLESRLQPVSKRHKMLDLFGQIPWAEDETTMELYQRFQSELNNGNWQGDRDAWHAPVDDEDWIPLTVDNAGCLKSRCSYFQQCCYFQAKQSVEDSDVIVTNQDLVLADLALGGGIVLPMPQNSIYIFDEGHNLSKKSNSHFASSAKIKSTLVWLDTVLDSFTRLDKEKFFRGTFSDEIKSLCRQSKEGLQQLSDLLQQILEDGVELNSYGQLSRMPFKQGRIPEPVKQVTDDLVAPFKKLTSLLENTADELAELVEESTNPNSKATVEQLYPLIGTMRKRCESVYDLLFDFARDDSEGEAPFARWLTLSERDDFSDIELSVSPVLAATNLEQSLWSECAAAVVTSATLSALGKFDVLEMRTGLPERTCYLRISSPFNYAEAATLSIPQLGCDPSDVEAHTAAIVNALPQLLQSPMAAIMLFSSRKQMRDVLEKLPEEIVEIVLCQDEHQKNQLLKEHRKRVDNGDDSLIFGLASFAEGVDLPGDYCTHVLIAKIPFSQPNDPVESTLSAWLEEKGEKPFFALQVPDAAFGLMQACGRLLRSESDKGKITLFDQRIVNKGYGRQILESLPPYHREIFKESYQVPAR